MDDAPGQVEVTVIIDGEPKNRILDGRSTVAQIIGELLSEDQKAHAGDYALSPEDGPPLDPASRVGDDDIPGGSVLALTKNDGGGGACSMP